MTINKRKKNSRQRGSKTYGYGAKKKHRGFGNKGGKGMAGSGKRADSKKPSLWKKRYFGKHGFKGRNHALSIKPFNLKYIEDNLDSLVKNNIIDKENEFYNVDSKKLGFNKLLSNGKVMNKLKIKVMFASKNAVEKVKAAGGEVIGLEINKEVKEKA